MFNLYDIFCESERFHKEIKDVKIQDGKRVGLLYEFVSLNFSAYYKYSKPHFIKNKEITSQSGNNENASKTNDNDVKKDTNIINKNNS